MKKHFNAVSLLMIPAYWHLIFCGVLICLFILISMGFSISENLAVWYGLRLIHFHIVPEKIIENAYLEFISHFWWFSLIFLNCFSLKNLMRSQDQSFGNFLRFSKSSLLRFEMYRIAALTLTLFWVICPFLFASIWGCFFLDLPPKAGLRLLCMTLSSLFFVEGVIYLFSWNQTLRLFCPYLLLMPFFTGGISWFLKKQNAPNWIYEWMPRLPYAIEDTNSVKILTMSVMVWLGIICLGIIRNYRTQWLVSRCR